MTGYRNRLQGTCAGIVACLIACASASGATAQQRPLSINDWLQAERSNANMQRAVEQYERARFGTATPPQPQYRQPQYQQPQYQQPQYPQQAQAPAAAPQQPVQQQQMPQQPMQQPAQNPPQPLYPNQQPYANQAQPGGQLPQGQTGQNTYQVPPDALEKIDREVQQSTPIHITERGFYAGGSLGWSTTVSTAFEATNGGAITEPEMSLLAFRAEGFAGYKYASGISFEMSGSYNYADFDTSDGYTSVFSFMPVAKKEFDFGQKFMPYVSGGLGLGILTVDELTQSTTTSDLSDSGLVVTYQIGAGVMFPLDDTSAVDFGYRYFGTTDADLTLGGTEYTGEFSSHTWSVGYNTKL